MREAGLKELGIYPAHVGAALLWEGICALRVSIKVIKQNTQYTQSWPFSRSLEGIVWKYVYGRVKLPGFQGNG